MLNNLGIIGIGGVGGYFGGKLCQALTAKPGNQQKVCFVARGNHLEEIRKHGLLLSTENEGDFICHPQVATDSFKDLPVLDLCLISVKGYDLHQVLTAIKDRTTGNTLILPLLNGIDVYERVREVIEHGIVFPACAYLGSHVERPGKVTQKGGSCKILFGKDPRHPDFMPEELQDLLAESHIKYAWLENADSEIWRKFMFIAPFALVTACFNKTLGEVMASRTLGDQVLCIMKELLALSRAKGVSLPDAIVAESFSRGKDFPYETKTSFQRDFERFDKPDERDLFGGTIMRLGQALGIDVVCTTAIYEQLHALSRKN
jgi:2-dehydropantoate 2-reductase